jgi:hypothetical protein
MDKEEILNHIKSACMLYGLKAMANDLGKPYSTLSNELDHRDFAKLGFLTTLSILENSHASYAPTPARDAAVQAMDLIENALGRIAFQVPEPSDKPVPQTMRLMADMSKGFANTMQTLADAIDDGAFTADEIMDCLSATTEVIKVSLQLKHHLKSIHPRPRANSQPQKRAAR